MAIFLRKNYSKKVKNANFGQKCSIFGQKAKTRAFLKIGPTDEFQNNFYGFSFQFGYRNCKNLKRALQLNWNIDAVYYGPKILS